MAGTFNRIIHGDCVEELAKLPAGCVDLAFADPPFNIGYDYDEYDDKRTCDDYLGWSREWISGVQRVLRPWGAFWLAIGDDYAAELKVLATRELGFVCRSWVVWYYTFGVHCTHKFTRSHTHLFYFINPDQSEIKDKGRRGRSGDKAPSNGKTRNRMRVALPAEVTFNADDIRVPSARQLVYGDKRANPKGRLPDDTWLFPQCREEKTTEHTGIRGGKNSSRTSNHNGWILRPQDLPEGFVADSDTWYYPRVCGTFKERGGFHGCQMPEQLLGRIVRACSHEGDLVLDPFSGSGTTLAVAKKLGRHYVGTELSKEYVTEARSRLRKAKTHDPLDGFENPLTTVPNTKNGTVRTKDGRRVRRSR